VQAFHPSDEGTLIAPPLPSVAQDLGQAIHAASITPPEAIAIDEDDATQDLTITDARLAATFRIEGLLPRYLRVGLLEKGCL